MVATHTTPPKAIPTRYAGCHFRSRLEARWAVFFDHLGIRWDYEPQGFEIYGGHYYLPDFYLPDKEMWVEVKGQLTGRDFATILNAVDYGGALPGISNNTGLWDCRGLLLLGPIPRPPAEPHPLDALLITSRTDSAGRVMWPQHSLFTHRKGVERSLVFFTSVPGLEVFPSCPTSDGWSAGGNTDEPLTPARADGLLNPAPREITLYDSVWRPVARAYNAARSARFEHGQAGA